MFRFDWYLKCVFRLPLCLIPPPMTTTYRVKAREGNNGADHSLEKKRGKSLEKPSKPQRPTVSVVVDSVTYALPARRTKSVLVETKNWGKVNFALDERYKKLE